MEGLCRGRDRLYVAARQALDRGRDMPSIGCVGGEMGAHLGATFDALVRPHDGQHIGHVLRKRLVLWGRKNRFLEGRFIGLLACLDDKRVPSTECHGLGRCFWNLKKGPFIPV